MNSVKSILSIVLIAGFVAAFTGCSENEDPLPVVATTFTNLAADPGTGFNPTNGQPTGLTRQFTFFSFKSGDIVAHADSATNKWDLGFNGTTIIVNSATSGPGTSQAQVVSGIFDELAMAPTDSYKLDNDVAPIAGAPNANLAIPTGSGQGWYTYDGANMVNKPTAGKIIVVKTSEGRYAKMEILSYYKDAPANPTFNNTARYYTFRYVYQPNETNSFN
ncbi:MAG: HmuY family protein [Cyclobacteriaceae bacterium]